MSDITREGLEKALNFYRSELEKFNVPEELVENHYVIKAGELDLTGDITVTDSGTDRGLLAQLEVVHQARRDLLLKKIIDLQLKLKEI